MTDREQQINGKKWNLMKLENVFYYFAGVGFLFLAKVENTIEGYSSPKPFPIDEHDKCIEYDLRVVNHWLLFLNGYTAKDDYSFGKNVLELGPGSDLGIGLYLLYKGVAKYNAIDVNNLIKNVPHRFYELLFKSFTSLNGVKDIEFLRSQLDKTQRGDNDKLNYICRHDFDIASSFGKETIDIIFSQASFEHFDDVENTVQHLSLVAKKGAVLVAEIDLKTHSRWICDKDPNNIYRYGQKLYDLFYFRGIPNRIRPFKYKEIFERNGWENVLITPLSTLNDMDFDKFKCHSNKNVHDERNQMKYLSIILCAMKK